MQIINDIKLDFQDVLIRPKRSKTVSRSKVNLIRKYKFLNSNCSWEGVPIISSNMDATGTLEMAETLSKHGMMTALHKHYPIKYLIDFYKRSGDELSKAAWHTFYTLGIKDEDFDKLKNLPNYPIYFCIDVANGYQDYFVNRVSELRELVGQHAVIMAGNVCTPEMTQELLISGADIVKIGIGPGSVCSTRKITGVGYPQLSAIIECADTAHGCDGHICADGGCREPGDVVKAFGAGADFVMLGGMFAGTDENEGTWRYWEHKPAQKKSFEFYGMSSEKANISYSGGLKKYRAAEGKSEIVPYKGPVEKVLQSITGGLRSACAYVGTDDLKNLSKCATFIRVNRTTGEL